jgi:hypothetical protein
MGFGTYQLGVEALHRALRAKGAARLYAQQVLGNAKGVVGSVVAVLVFRNTVTVQSILGYTITVAGA